MMPWKQESKHESEVAMPDETDWRLRGQDYLKGVDLAHRRYRRYPLDWTVAAWGRAGFSDVRARVMSLGGGLVMWAQRGHA